jgi:hypothetical protein
MYPVQNVTKNLFGCRSEGKALEIEGIEICGIRICTGHLLPFPNWRNDKNDFELIDIDLRARSRPISSSRMLILN